MTTRAQIIAGAYERIGVADYAFDVTPDERAAARRKLDTMMAQWAGAGVSLGYVPSAGDNDSVVMTTPAYADAPITDNLAIRIAGSFGKTPDPELRRDARRGYDLVVTSALAIPAAARAPLTVAGGGNWWRDRLWGY